MIAILYIFLLAASVLLGGCRRPSQPSEEKAQVESKCRMIHIENLAVTERTLTLDYQVSNHFGYGIWVCEDIDVYSIYQVETRIDAETVWIKLRSNLESNVFLDIGALAKYRLLSPGESYSGRILLNLPIRNDSPVYDFGEDRKEHKQILLHRAVFEVGYFGGVQINAFFVTSEMRRRAIPIEERRKTEFEPRIEEEIEDGQSRTFLYLTNTWPSISEQKSDKVDITDINIPCSVVVDDK